MQNITFILVLFSSIAARAEFDPTVVERDERGQVIYMTQPQAQAHCEGRGSRLPGNRDFASYAIARGAELKETAFPDQGIFTNSVSWEKSEMNSAGFVAVYKESSRVSGLKVIDFYISGKKYVAPAYDWRAYSMWSSSLRPDDKNYGYEFFIARGSFYEGICTLLSCTRYFDFSAVACMD